MNQPPFQPPAQPPQPPHSAQPYNPYAQPPLPPQQTPGFGQPPAPVGLTPVPGQPSMYSAPHPAQPFQVPPVAQPNSGGNPVGAIFLGLFASVVLSLLYSGLIMATYKEQSVTTSNVLYFAHALLNGAVVGFLVGSVGRGNNGAGIGGAVIAALGAFFGYANSIPLVFAMEGTPKAAFDLLEHEPFLPAKLWWHNNTGGVDWLNLLGLVLAAAVAWGLCYVIGKRRRQA
ncbi:hypothetical protein OHT68_13595 [Streptomyces canus]|uniref:hypothetical protein n=1 Tax=Streptomyces canus TaxID=58343 RepID=UPI002E2C7842|nr:hypothetical protein [Streptomyces canus]